MNWVVFQEHEYFGTTIISIEKTKSDAIKKIHELIKEQSLWLKEGKEWKEQMLKKMSVSDDKIFTSLGFCAQKID